MVDKPIFSGLCGGAVTF